MPNIMTGTIVDNRTLWKKFRVWCIEHDITVQDKIADLISKMVN